MKEPKILLGIPCAPQVDTNAVTGLMAACHAVMVRGGKVANFVYRRTDVARNTFVKQLLESDCDWLMMLDSDHLHPVNLVANFVELLQAKPEIKILSGWNYRRSAPYEPMAYQFDDKGKIASIKPGWSANSFMKVGAVATCALMVHRRVFEAMTMPWFYYAYSTESEMLNNSEDISFCKKLHAETDYEIWVHTSLTSPHITLATVGNDTAYREWLAAQEAEDAK